MRRKGWLILALGLIVFAQTARADWTAKKRLSWTSSYSYHPAIAIDSSYYLHVVWDDFTPGNWEIYYKRSTNGGTDWSTSQRLTWNSTGSSLPAIVAAPPNSLQLVYEDHMPGPWQIYHKRSTDGGDTWTAAKRLSWTTGQALQPALAVDSEESIHVVWQDNASGNQEIYYKKSTDNGATWSASKRLTWNSGSSYSPALAIDSSDYLHVIWSDQTPGVTELYYKNSMDGGDTWSANKRITWVSGIASNPAIAADSLDSLHVVWDDPPPMTGELLYKKSADGGVNWGAVQTLTWNAGRSEEPSIKVALNDDIYVVWKDNSSGDMEIYYKVSEDGGTSWTAGTRITYIAGDSRDLAFVLDSLGDVNLVWSDDYPGNYEIYFKKGN